MFLTQSEADLVLNLPQFSVPVTESSVDYTFYRGGKKKTSVLTVRFNLTPAFARSYMLSYLQDRLTSHPYTLQSRVVASVHYDLLLRNLADEDRTKTYYIWRAHTNHATLNVDQETTLTINHANITRFCQTATDVNPADLNANFITSAVVVDRVLAIVFSFHS
jgi:hypothetical protein